MLVLSVLGLAAFLAVEALLLRHYIRVDTRPPSWDQSTHMEIALDYREALGAGRWGDAWFLAPKPGMPPFPPAYHLLLRGAFASSDPAHAALWANWLYMAVLAVSLFGISWRFLPDGRALAATLAFCAAPGLQDLLTTQLVDLAVVSWAAAGYWALLSSEGFTEWLPSLAFGVLHAVGMMHKWTYFSYMLPAYLIAARASSIRGARLKVAAAAALSLALSAPWYWSHMALLPSRLVQASADFAVPFWKGSAWFSYVRQSCSALGPLLWGLGFVSLISPQYARRRESGWVLAYWVVASYIFWTVVPNRQIRFLLPALPPLAVAMAATWPRGLTWGVAAFQLLAMANFFFGAIGPLWVRMPFMPLEFFQNRPPAAEDWKIEEILRRVEADRDPTRPITNVTLVANDDYFNGPTFHWVQRRLNLPHVRMRGVNKRLCELSEFVLLKSGSLGPDDVIGGLPEAAQRHQRSRGLVLRGLRGDRPLAPARRQRRGAVPPAPRPPAAGRAASTSSRRLTGERSPARACASTCPAGTRSTRRGAEPARASTASACAGCVRDAAVDLENFSFVSLAPGDWRATTGATLRLTRLDRVDGAALEIDAADLKAFLEKRVPGLKLDALTLDGTVKASGKWKGRPVAAEAALELDRAARRLKVRVVSASYMGGEVPPALFRPIKELDLSLDPNPETPFYIDIPGLTIKNGKLTVP